MNGRPWAWALGALLVASAATVAGADDDRAKRKGGGGSSGGGSAVAGERHHSGGSSRSGGEARAGGEVRSGGGRAAAIDSQRESGGSRGRSSRVGDDPPARRVTGAESRHPVAGTGHGWRVGRLGSYWSSPYYYSRYPSRSYYWYRPYYWGFYGVPYYGFYSSSWDYPYGGGGYYGGYQGGGGYYGGYRDRYRYRETGSIRTLVDPERTTVLVDGYYAGTVDDFDGMFQRLYVAPGRHDITFKLEGYRTHRVRVYVTEDHTVKIRHDMQKGSGEDTLEDLTEGREDPPYRMSDDGRGEDRTFDERRDSRDAGTLRLEVRPDDASIYVDGEFFGSARRAGSMPLAPGRHRIEVVRPGFRTVEREVEIQPGRTESLAIDLSRS